jgi:hypothetical protein
MELSIVLPEFPNRSTAGAAWGTATLGRPAIAAQIRSRVFGVMPIVLALRRLSNAIECRHEDLDERQ